MGSAWRCSNTTRTASDDLGRGYSQGARPRQHMGHLIDHLIVRARVARGDASRVRRSPRAAGDVLAELQKNEPGRRVEYLIEPWLWLPRAMPAAARGAGQPLGNAWKFTGKQAHALIEFGAWAEDRGGNRADGGLLCARQRRRFQHAIRELALVPSSACTRRDRLSGTGHRACHRPMHRPPARRAVRAEGRPGAGATFYFHSFAENPSMAGLASHVKDVIEMTAKEKVDTARG